MHASETAMEAATAAAGGRGAARFPAANIHIQCQPKDVRVIRLVGFCIQSGRGMPDARFERWVNCGALKWCPQTVCCQNCLLAQACLAKGDVTNAAAKGTDKEFDACLPKNGPQWLLAVTFCCFPIMGACVPCYIRNKDGQNLCKAIVMETCACPLSCAPCTMTEVLLTEQPSRRDNLL